MVGGLWMTDANFKSTIYLRNDVETDPVTVTPILWLSNGKKFVLNDVTLEPAGISVININQALANQGVSSWATLTGYVEIQYTWQWDALCVIVWNVDVSHSLILTSGLAPSLPPAAQTTASPQNQVLEGMWWKQEANVSGFVALSNTSAEPIHAAVQVSDAAGNSIGTHSVTISSHGTKIVKMPELQVAGSYAGGVRVAYAGPAGVLIPNGGLEDEAVGYSARMPFTTPPTPSTTPAADSYAELGLMTGAADPMMSFPAGTTFAPYSVVRNISDKPIQLTPTLWWMEAGKPRSASSYPFAVSPGQTKDLDPVSLLSAAGLKNFNGSVNLVLNMQGTVGGLLPVAGSVDHKNTYVFEDMPTRVHEGIAKSISYWSIANGDDTMVTVWNPADEAQDFVFTLFFSGGHYDFPIHLGPRATNTFNISEIVHNQIPDAEGNVIPASVHEGSARISGTLGAAQSILVSMDAGTYNVVKATCGQGCQTCNGWVPGSFIDSTPVDVAVSSTNTVKFIVPFKDGTQRDYTAQSTWNTDNHAVATVQSAGVIKGMSTGSFNTSVQGPSITPAVPCCNLTGGCCAPPTSPGGGGPGLGFTPIQHNYPRNPLPEACRISSFFDAVRNQLAHHAEDVVFDNGNGGGTVPAYGTPVYAMESGTVVAVASGNGPSSLGYPGCAGTGALGNYVKIKGSDGYFTIYFHVAPSVSLNQQISQGQQIGVLDNSGCQSGAHLHVGRKNPSGTPVNFTIPCTNPTPTTNFFDGLVGCDVPTDL
jgi:hypothetical protein